MKKLVILMILAIIAVAACSKAKTANVATNTTANLTNSVNTNPVIPPANSTLPTNIPNQNSPAPANQNSDPQTTIENKSDIHKQIEQQQLETADPRKVTKQNSANNASAPKKSAPAGKQTW